MVSSVRGLAQDLPVPSPYEVVFAKTFIDAEKERTLGNYSEALELFDQCLSINPKSDAVHFGLGKLFLEQQMYVLAGQAFKRAYELDRSNKWYALSYAQVLVEQLNFKEAAKVYKEVAAANPRDTELRIDYANTLFYAGKEKSAIKEFGLIEKESGLTPEITQRKYDYFISVKKFDLAENELVKLLEVFPEDVQLYAMLAELYKAQGKVKEALQMYQSAYRVDPQNPEFQLSLAEYFDRNGQRDTAFVYLNRAFENPNLDIDRKVGVLLRLIPDAERNAKTLQQSLLLCEALVETHPNEAKSYSVYGDYLNISGQPSSALEMFRMAVEHDPSKFAIWSQIMLLNAELGLLEQLVTDSDRAMELFPAQPTIYFYNGMASAQLKDWVKASNSLKVGAQMVIGNKELSTQMLATLGDVYHELEKNQSSDSAYEAALVFDSANAYVLNNYSYFLSLRGEKLLQAKQMAIKAVAAEPTNPSYLDTYGWVLYRLGEFDKAEIELAKALMVGGANSAEVHEHYADILFALGRSAEAKDHWQKALDLGGDNERLTEKLNGQLLNDH